MRSMTEPLTPSDSGDYNHRLAGEVAGVIANYHPRMLPRYWDPIAEFTRAAVTDLQIPSPKRAAHFMMEIGRLANWAVTTGGLDLTREQILQPSTITRYVAANFSNPNAREQRNRVSILSRSSGTLLPGLNGTEIARPDASVRESHPYLPSDFPGLASWAARQHSVAQRRDANAMLGLCAGAGLRTGELFALRVSDIEVTESGLLVLVGGRYPRQVPVHHIWEHHAREAIATADSLSYVLLPNQLRNHNQIDPVRSGRLRHEFVPNLGRLRSTWLARALSLIPLRAASYYTGIEHFGALTKHLPHTAPIDVDRCVDLLRGKSGTNA